MILDAVRKVTADRRIVGFMFCGDTNCGLLHRATALIEERIWEMHFERPRKLYASEAASSDPTMRKHSDVTVVFAVKGEQFAAVQIMCQVSNREKQHDVMIAGWCYRARPLEPERPLPA